MRRRLLLPSKKNWFYLEFPYTGEVQSVTLPKGKYKLLCWGAQGGGSTGSHVVNGSKGGYSEGVLTLNKQTTLYVFVGGDGLSENTNNRIGVMNGGWNGGGGSRRYAYYIHNNFSGESFPRPGGGSTDIALVSSTMSYDNYVTNRSSESLLSRFIVAGGGAGSSYTYYDNKSIYWFGSRLTSSFYYGNADSSLFYFSTDFSVDKESQVVNRFKCTNYSTPSKKGVNKFTVNYFDGNNILLFSSDIVLNNEYVVPKYTSTIRVIVYINTTTSENFSDASATCTINVGIYNPTTTSSPSNMKQYGGGKNGGGTACGKQTGDSELFGKGVSQLYNNYRSVSGAGGGGWYGGGTDYSDTIVVVNNCGGGSGFVNTAANAGSRPSGYTGLQLDSGETKAGDVSFPSTNGGTEVGHHGNGYAIITELDKDGNIPIRK